MPDYPAEVIQSVAEVLLRQHVDSSAEHHLSWRDFTREAREVLDAAAPVLAGEIARKILAHMEAHGPAAASPGVTLHETMRRAWRRHFGIAARVAAGAFSTREDQLRMAAEAIERGGLIACDISEVPGA